MGIPTASAESFELLQAQKVIDKALAQRLRRMVSFRNTVVHHYQRLEMDIVKGVITSGLDDLILFGQRVLEFFDVE